MPPADHDPSRAPVPPAGADPSRAPVPAADPDTLASDPGRWGASLANLRELLLACLDAAGARSVVEVGAYAGDLTGLLLAWAERADASVVAIDPAPKDALVRLADRHGRLELIRATSHDALRRIPLPDALILDGDHNYFTVGEELRIVAERADGRALPLLLAHDVCWPHARRDSYEAPERIPAEQRQPVVDGGGLHPEEAGIRRGGLPMRASAAREGGPRNGVLTAVEDFVRGREDLRLAVVPAFFGLGVVWPHAAPWSPAVADVLDPWDGNALLARLEANRVHHLATSHVQMVRAARAGERLARQEALLRRLLESSAFSVAERLSRLRVRAGIAPAQSVISKQEVRRALGEE